VQPRTIGAAHPIRQPVPGGEVGRRAVGVSEHDFDHVAEGRVLQRLPHPLESVDQLVNIVRGGQLPEVGHRVAVSVEHHPTPAPRPHEGNVERAVLGADGVVGAGVVHRRHHHAAGRPCSARRNAGPRRAGPQSQGDRDGGVFLQPDPDRHVVDARTQQDGRRPQCACGEHHPVGIEAGTVVEDDARRPATGERHPIHADANDDVDMAVGPGAVQIGLSCGHSPAVPHRQLHRMGRSAGAEQGAVHDAEQLLTHDLSRDADPDRRFCHVMPPPGLVLS